MIRVYNDAGETIFEGSSSEYLEFERNQKAIKASKEMRLRSGNVTSTGQYDRLTSFLYTLLRDYLSAGAVESIMLTLGDGNHTEYSNGWVAGYAKDVARRLL